MGEGLVSKVDWRLTTGTGVRPDRVGTDGELV
jgi:hypothetical protein